MEVYIYHKDISKELKGLSGEEKSRKDRHRYASAVGKKLLELALKEEYGESLQEFTIERGKHGKPYFRDREEVSPLYFNISHTKECVVCGVSRVEIGVDVELLRDKPTEALARKIMSKEKYEQYKVSSNQLLFFYRQWVRMESFLKYTGEGISRDVSNLRYEGLGTLLCVQENHVGCLWSKEPVKVCLRKIEEFKRC